jgi:short-subunit dehydrogenase
VAEALFSELRQDPTSPLERLSVVALCPGIVNTDLLDSGAEATNGTVRNVVRKGDLMSENTMKGFRRRWEQSMSAE